MGVIVAVYNFADSRQLTVIENIKRFLESALPIRAYDGDANFVAADHCGLCVSFVTLKHEIPTGVELPGDDFAGLLTLYEKTPDELSEIFRVAFKVVDGTVIVRAIRQPDGRLWSAVLEFGPWFAWAIKSPVEVYRMTDDEIAEMDALDAEMGEVMG